jgi:hypothetical protein
MKLHLTLSGRFQRTLINQSRQESVTLEAWMQSYQTVATQVRARSPQLLRQHFGLHFLSEPLLVQLLQQAHQTESAEKRDRISSFELRQPLKAPVAQPTFYRYQFVNSEAQIELESDDPQLPSFWKREETAQNGVYKVIVDSDRYPGLSETWLNSHWQLAQQVWQNYTPLEQIQMALRSSETTCVYFYPGVNESFVVRHRQDVKVSVDNNELPVAIQEAIAYLKQPQINLSKLSTAAQTLVQNYQEKYNLSPTHFQFPQDLKLDLSIPSQHQFIIGKGKSRRAIDNLIGKAQQFLFISSYIIEDESLTQLICHKATTLPQGVWILTDLRDEVVDRIDTQVENEDNLSNYQRSDKRKAKCLSMLLDAGAHIRGGAFHLKTYISEKAAYLGSCNLTGGSLDFNLEGGLICQGTSSCQDLLQYFTQFWQYKTGYDVLPSFTKGNFIQRSLNRSSAAPQLSSKTLLTPSQYRNDLERELSQFRGQIEIYSRGCFADAAILSLLETHYTRVYFESFTNITNSRIFRHFLPGLHAKITLLGDRVAYLGGVNFHFTPQGFNLIDLMYKTSDRQEIKQIRQQLTASSF